MTGRQILAVAVVLASVPLVATRSFALEPGLPQRTHSVSGSLRLGVLRGEPTRLERDAGFGFGVGFRWFYEMGLALMIQADYDRFGSPNDVEDQLSRTTFTAMQAIAWPIDKLLPWAALGGGVGVGVFRTPDRETEPMEITDVVPVIRSALGVGYEFHRRVTAGVSVNYDWVLGGDSVSVRVGSERHEVTVFDDTVHFAAAVDYYF